MFKFSVPKYFLDSTEGVNECFLLIKIVILITSIMQNVWTFIHESSKTKDIDVSWSAFTEIVFSRRQHEVGI